MTRFGLVRANLKRGGMRVLGLSLAVSVGVAASAVVLTLENDAQRLLSAWSPAGDRSLTVEPPRATLAGFSQTLNDAALTRLRALSDVERAIPRMSLRAPAISEYRGSFFGTNLALTVEIAAEGVAEDAMAPALFPGEQFSWREGLPIPACISQELVRLYNSTFAPARSLPFLDSLLLRGFELPLMVGASMVGAKSSRPEALVARIVCVSPDAMLAGLTLPLAAVRAMNLRQGLDGDTYSSVTLIARSSADLSTLETAVVDAGFRIGEAQATGRRLSRAIAVSTEILWFVVSLILVLAIALVAIAFQGDLRARAAELRLLRALGATTAFLALQSGAEAVCIGSMGSILGVAAAALVGTLAPLGLQHVGVQLPIALPPIDWRAALMAFFMGPLAAVSGAAIAAWQTRRQLT